MARPSGYFRSHTTGLLSVYHVSTFVLTLFILELWKPSEGHWDNTCDDAKYKDKFDESV